MSQASSAAHHDLEAPRRLEGARRAAALSAGRFDVDPVLLEALVDLMPVRLARLDEADVERLWIAHCIGPRDPDQRQNEAVVIGEHVEVLVALAGRAQAEVALEESPCRGHVVDRKMKVVELHRLDQPRTRRPTAPISSSVISARSAAVPVMQLRTSSSSSPRATPCSAASVAWIWVRMSMQKRSSSTLRVGPRVWPAPRARRSRSRS